MLKALINYLKQYGVDANTTTTIFITVIVFGAGLLFAWIGGQIKNQSQKKEYKRGFIYILKDFSESCSRQYKMVIHSLENASMVEGKDFIISQISIGTLDYLNRIDLNILVQNIRRPFLYGTLFGRKNYSKAISKLIAIIYGIKVLNDQSSGKIEKFSN